ncbi:MAG: thioether cross-link-forming SCIFF peptide maturase [Hyphomonadaceae bacterium]|nr:thioether cross-link-forming SCIFF peptide maturase [Clostridia bacterium]
MVHAFLLHGTAMLLDVYSGAVHVVDQMVVDIVQLFEQCTKQEILSQLQEKYTSDALEEGYEEVAILKQQGLLFAQDSYEAIATQFDQPTVVKALCLHIAHDCNLRCKYCFAETGSFHGSRSMMQLDVGKAAIDFVIEKSGNRKNIEIDFFGGEPLMNFEVVKQIVHYAKQQGEQAGKHFRFTITTNGMLLNADNSAFINEHMVNVVLSLDGDKQVNDAMRPRIDGSGTYDRIVPMFRQLAKERAHQGYFVRGTFTSQNLEFAKDVLHLADLGFEQISVEPVVAPDDKHYALKEAHLPILFLEYEKLAQAFVERSQAGQGFHFFHFALDLSGGPCAQKRLKGCGSGYEYLAVTPEGDLYPCHQFVGNTQLKMGDVFEKTIDASISKSFRERNVYTQTTCKDCWAKFYCSGGCPANAHQLNGDMDKPYEVGCALMKKRIECALWIKAMLG